MSERRSRMRLLWPLGPWPVVVPALAIFLVVLSDVSARWELPYQDWPATSTMFMEQLQFAGPLAALAAAYWGSRVLPPGRLFALRPGQRSALQVIARNLMPLLGWLMLAYTAPLVSLVVLSSRDATDGRLLVGPVVTGLLGLAAFTVAGFTLGAAIPGFAAVPAAFLAAFGVVLLGIRDVTRLSPVPSFPFSIGSLPATPLIGVRLVVLSLAIIGCGAYLVRLAVGTRRPPVLGAVSFGGVVAFALLAQLTPPQVARVQAQPPHVCTTKNSTTFCVHRGHLKQLPALEAAAEPILAAYGHATDGRQRVYDGALGGDPRLQQRPVNWILMGPQYDMGEQVKADLPSQLVPLTACQARFRNNLPNEVIDLYSYLWQWLADEDHRVATSESDYPHLRTLGQDEMRAWLRDHRRQLNTCTVDLTTLPR